MRRLIALLSAAFLIATVGCKKKSAPVAEQPAEAPAEAAPAAAPAEADASPKIANGPEMVRAALEKRQWDEAVRGAFAIQAMAGGNPERLKAAALLKEEVKMKLIEEAPRDQKAAEALGMIRAMTMGR